MFLVTNALLPVPRPKGVVTEKTGWPESSFREEMRRIPACIPPRKGRNHAPPHCPFAPMPPCRRMARGKDSPSALSSAARSPLGGGRGRCESPQRLRRMAVSQGRTTQRRPEATEPPFRPPLVLVRFSLPHPLAPHPWQRPSAWARRWLLHAGLGWHHDAAAGLGILATRSRR